MNNGNMFVIVSQAWLSRCFYRSSVKKRVEAIVHSIWMSAEVALSFEIYMKLMSTTMPIFNEEFNIHSKILTYILNVPSHGYLYF